LAIKRRAAVVVVALSILTGSLHAAQFWLGWNEPWRAYGHDFGRNNWGHDGLSNDGWSPNGGFVRSRVVAGEPCAHCGALRIDADLDTSQPSGEIVLDLASHLPTDCPTGVATSQDFHRARVRFRLWLPRGAAGPRSARSGIQVIFKTKLAGERWASVYTKWQNIEPSQEESWTDFIVPVSFDGAAYVDAGADLARVRLVGFKVGINSQSTGRIVGSIYVDDYVIETEPPVSWDFERLGIEREFTAIRRASRREMTVARVFLCADGRSCPEFAPNRRVTSFDDGAFYDDFEALLQSAERTGVRLIITLFDYSLARRSTSLAGVELGGRADLIRIPDERESFLDDGLAPLLRRYANHPAIQAWQPINEPEWVVEELPERIPEGIDYIPLEAMREFVRLNAEYVHRLSPHHDVTIGSAKRAWARLWTGLDLDGFGVHWYETSDDGQLSFLPCPEEIDRPCYVEEVPTSGTPVRASTFLTSAQSSGYGGLALWSCRARDQYSDLPKAIFDLNGWPR
jgi:hypothetical protein